MNKLLLTLSICLLILALPVAGYAEWDVGIPVNTDNWTDWPADSQANNLALDGLLSQYPKGITLSFSSATTVVASTGGVVCSNAAGTIRKFRNNTSTTSITFADIDAGAEANDTYYVYAVGDAVATTATFILSLSSTAPTGVTYYKRIGSFYNDSGLDITYITNDNSRSITSTGSIAHGATISLPSGWTNEEECDWTVSGYSIYGCGEDCAGGGPDQYYTYASSARVVTCYSSTTGGNVNGTCQYFIMCLR